MTHAIKTTVFGGAIGLAALSMAMLSIPAFVHGADYAYVDSQGEVRSVTANDWMTAIATAPSIAYNSGVYLLKSAADFAHLLDANN